MPENHDSCFLSRYHHFMLYISMTGELWFHWSGPSVGTLTGWTAPCLSQDKNAKPLHCCTLHPEKLWSSADDLLLLSSCRRRHKQRRAALFALQSLKKNKTKQNHRILCTHLLSDLGSCLVSAKVPVCFTGLPLLATFRPNNAEFGERCNVVVKSSLNLSGKVGFQRQVGDGEQVLESSTN